MKDKLCRIVFNLLLLSLAVLDAQPMAFAQQPLSSNELIDNAKQYDTKTVVYAGEVIGDVMTRGEFSWVNLNDGKNALGIWMPKDLAKSIKYKGSYTYKGDWVEVTGVFNRACALHGGDLDIHAQIVRNVASGRLAGEKPNIDKMQFSLIFLGGLIFIWILSLLKKK